MNLRPFLPAVIGALAVLGFAVSASQTGTTRFATPLKSEPFLDADVLSELGADTDVTVLRRQGGWYELNTPDELSGWARLTSIRLNAGESTASGDGDSGLSSVVDLVTEGRAGSSDVVASTGVRGMDAQDIENSTPDPAAVDGLAALVVDEAAARNFAGELQLASQDLAYLQMPEDETLIPVAGVPRDPAEVAKEAAEDEALMEELLEEEEY